ncbi:hypothetical protein LCGC14_1001240 [marine sediment metagenome]|uniref:Uncharacterized protein n=1 Tax=marine sediment metagenome TaxID=412755 RepID=A0A0F9R940_9ZZZZ
MATESSTSRRTVVQLEWDDEDTRVVATDEGKHKLVLTTRQAILACKWAADYETFKSAFDILITRLGQWKREHDEQISDAYLTVREAELMFVVVKKTQEYDREFEDSLTDLDIAIAQDEDFEMINLSVLELPNAPDDSVAVFLSPTNTLKY